MKCMRSAATAALAGAMSIAAAGLAGADPPIPSPPHWPTPAPADRPGATIGVPGNPSPPGWSDTPPAGHTGPMPQDAGVPTWAPPAPPPPIWAPWLPVVWNTELNAWGVYWNNSFQPLP